MSIQLLDHSVVFNDNSILYRPPFGFLHNWTVLTVGTQRISGTVYTNANSYPIEVFIHSGGTTTTLQFKSSSGLWVNAIPTYTFTVRTFINFVVPGGCQYIFTSSIIYAWWELI